MLNRLEKLWKHPKRKLILWLFALIYITAEARNSNDFEIYLQASRDLFNGINIYKTQYHQWYHYYYSLFFAVLLWPFTLLPAYLSLWIWLLLNVWLLKRIWDIVLTYFPVAKQTVIVLLTAIVILAFLRDNFHYGQITILILYLIIQGIDDIHRERYVRGAAFIALGINIKLLPLVLLPYLLYRSYYKAFIYCLIGILGLMFAPVLVLGYHYNLQLMQDWYALVNPTNSEHLIDISERSFHSLTTLIPTLLMKNATNSYDLLLKRNIADLPVSTVILIINIARILLISFMLYFLRTKPFVKAPNKLHSIWELSYLLLIVPLIFPHQQQYAFLLVMPAVAYLVYYVSEYPVKNIIIAIVVADLCFNLPMLLGTWRNYYTHYKITTYGTLLLIPLLAYCKPAKLGQQI